MVLVLSVNQSGVCEMSKVYSSEMAAVVLLRAHNLGAGGVTAFPSSGGTGGTFMNSRITISEPRAIQRRWRMCRAVGCPRSVFDAQEIINAEKLAAS